MFDLNFDGVWDKLMTQMHGEQSQPLKYPAGYCNGCSYGSHCLGADPDCKCCKAGDVGCYPK